MSGVNDLPALNAALNAAAATLLVAGYFAIRLRSVTLHKCCMLAALSVSIGFLASYLYYHLEIKSGEPTRFADRAPDAPQWVSWLYLAILFTHTILAVAVVPLVLITLWQAVRGNFKRHVRIARWTLPIWLYVSVTGVVVYWMLYRLYP